MTKQKEEKERLKPSGFNLTVGIKAQLYKIAAFMRTKRTDAIKKMFDLLFNDLVKDKGFKTFCDAYKKSQYLVNDKSTYTSFYIPPDYLQKFKDLMYDFGFIDRSPFLRLMIDYVYNHKVKPVEKDLLPQIKKDVESLGYTVENIVPVLDGKLFVLIENPTQKSTKRKPRT
ncbi:hypothetical protein ACFLRB_01350 [Acidobacteriota bacterium]